MYSAQASQTEGLWPPSAHLPDVHSRWLTEASLLSRQGQANTPTDMDPYPPYAYQEPALHTSRQTQQYDSSYHKTIAPSSPGSSPSHSHHSYSPSSQARHTVQSLIAPSLQIPMSVNATRGSLSELAAQITCLFWFESSAVLGYAADCPEILQPNPQPLGPDTIPTPGFRKWVTTILSTTQVAQNVILLALLFIYRLKKQNPSVRGKPGSEYRLLTVALMLGNKFLDDNTYTNKTWAEVSGISVNEVHIMEVEFLSNMKYNLFTSKSEWSSWQAQLGRFARFLDRAALSPTTVASLSPYTQNPSPPYQQTSPPMLYSNTIPQPRRVSQISNGMPPVVARPLPYDPVPEVNSRKRSLDDAELVSAAKRIMYTQPHYEQRSAQTTPIPMSRPYETLSQPPTLPTPLYPMMQHGPRETYIPPQLPPLAQQLSGVAALPSWQNTPASAQVHPNSLAMAMASARSSVASVNHSPHLSSNNVSPTSGVLLPASCLTPQHGQSPLVYLSQRDSPYKPIRGVHTLLVPPPHRAMHHDQVGSTQMQYQPLSKPFIQPQQGRLPYVTQNQWNEHNLHQIPLGPWWNRTTDTGAQ